MNRVFGILFGLLLAAGQGTESAEPVATEQSDASQLELFLLDPFEPPLGYSLIQKNAMTVIQARFGEPCETNTRHEVDRYARAPANIRYTSLMYSGLLVTVADRPGERGSWIHDAVITDKKIRLRFGLGIGARRSEVISALRPREFSEANSRLTIFGSVWEREYSDDPSDDRQVSVDAVVKFDFDDEGRVTQVVWDQSGH